jgi:hypothetical protein
MISKPVATIADLGPGWDAFHYFSVKWLDLPLREFDAAAAGTVLHCKSALMMANNEFARHEATNASLRLLTGPVAGEPYCD